MSDAQTIGPDEAATDKRNNRLELLAAIVLGIAALLTAFATFQAGKKGGEALQGYSQSSAQLSDANQFYNQGGQTSALDQSLFVEYAIATTEGNTDVADYLRGTLMRPELSEAIDWFDANDDAETPFDEAEDNPYTIEDYETANDARGAVAGDLRGRGPRPTTRATSTRWRTCCSPSPCSPPVSRPSSGAPTCRSSSSAAARSPSSSGSPSSGARWPDLVPAQAASGSARSSRSPVRAPRAGPLYQPEVGGTSR